MRCDYEDTEQEFVPQDLSNEATSNVDEKELNEPNTREEDRREPSREREPSRDRYPNDREFWTANDRPTNQKVGRLIYPSEIRRLENGQAVDFRLHPTKKK